MTATALFYLVMAIVGVAVWFAWPYAEQAQTPIRYVSEAEQQAQRDRLTKASQTTITRPRAGYTRNS